MSSDNAKIIFAERFSRLKLSLDVEADSQLSRKLGIRQQSVASAKRRGKIPGSWLETVGEKGISLDYIFFGKLPVMREEDEKLEIKEVVPEEMIAEQLVGMAISETGFNPSQAGKKILERFVKRKVSGDIKADVIEMLKDVMMSERESETSDDAD